MSKSSEISIFYDQVRGHLIGYNSLKQHIWWLITRTRPMRVLYPTDDLMAYTPYRDDLIDIVGIRGIDWDYRINKKDSSILEIKLSKKHESLISYLLLKWNCR